MNIRRNAMQNCHNHYQGPRKRVLVICSAGLLRSPSIANYLERTKGWNCRAAGLYDHALVQVDYVLAAWADMIICVHPDITKDFISRFPQEHFQGKLVTFNIDDVYGYKEHKLMRLISKEVENKL
jgi:predicted protein tyrosine phosphatase